MSPPVSGSTQTLLALFVPFKLRVTEIESPTSLGARLRHLALLLSACD